MPRSTMSSTHPQSTSPSSGGRLVDVSGRALPLLGARLSADACGGVARVVLAQRFRNPHDQPLLAKYTFPLPEGAAVSGFSFTLGGKKLVGKVDRRAAARAAFERAMIEGRGASILDQERTSLFTQEIGNVPPGEEILVEIVLDQPLAWLEEGAWEWRFPMAAAPRYLGAGAQGGEAPSEAESGPSGARREPSHVTLSVAAGGIPVAFHLDLRVRDLLATGRRPESVSHAIAARPDPSGQLVALTDAHGAPLDRDVVVRWVVARPRIGLSLDVTRPPDHAPNGGASYGLLTVTPPDASVPRAPLRRDVVLLLDTSGSMNGEPLRQAQRVASALVDTLGPKDTLEMIEFGNTPRRYREGATPMIDAERRAALAWIAGLRASGGTEMREGILEALRARGDGSQRQIVLVTDGLIGFEQEVIAAVLARLPRGSRVHTVGVGSAVNRSLTAPVARAGHGVEVILGLGEDPERAAKRIVARTDEPLAVDVEVSGSAVLEVAPAHAPDLFARAPALLALKLRPEGGEVIVRGRLDVGTYEERVHVPAVAPGVGSPGIAAIFARELVEDLETQIAGGGDRRALEQGIEEVGLAFQIATRLTSWIATTADVIVDPKSTLRREEIPQALPYGMSVEGLGLRTSVANDVFEDESVQTLSRSMAYAPAMSRPMSGAMPYPARAPSPPPSPEAARPTAPPPAQPAPPPPQGRRAPAPPPPAARSAPPPEAPRVMRLARPTDRVRSPRPAEAFVVVVHTSDTSMLGRRIPLTTPRVLVGRSSEGDVVLRDPAVARKHAILELRADGHWVSDLGSTNGVRVNEQPVREQRLAHGDLVQVGGTWLKYLEGEDGDALYHEEIYRLTVFDALTDVHSARFFLEELEREVARAFASGGLLAAVVFAVDDAERLARAHGDMNLDLLLRALAKVAKARVRGDELLGRYGARGFAVLLPRTQADAALLFAEELRRAVFGASFVVDGAPVKLTVSLGVAVLAPGDTPSSLSARAETALDAARAGGGDTVAAGGR